MRSLCAWCGTPLNLESATQDDRPITHGICPRCLAKVLSGYPVPLDDFLGFFDAGVMILDESGRAVSANGTACSLFRKELAEVRGAAKGVLFGCAYAHEESGCGHSSHCSKCTLRQVVDRCLHMGENKAACSILLQKDLGEGLQTCRVVISVERIGAGVMLRIDSVHEVPAVRKE